MEHANTQICKKCQSEKPMEKFPNHFHKKYKKRYYGKTCSACMSKEYRLTPKGKEIVRNIKKTRVAKYRASRFVLKQKLLQAIGQEQCQKCGYQDIRALSFHHRDPSEKSFAISWGFTHYYNFEKLLMEAQKCDVLCENCHALHHYVGESRPQRRRLLFKYDIMKEIKQTECLRCGCQHPVCLTFHHRDPNQKELKMSEHFQKPKQRLKIIEEAKKCDVLCRNCHFIEHASDQYLLSNNPSSFINRWAFMGLPELEDLPPYRNQLPNIPSDRTCKSCKTQKPITAFVAKKGRIRKDGTQYITTYPINTCNTCMARLYRSTKKGKESSRVRAARHSTKYNNQKTKFKKKLLDSINQYCCRDCKQTENLFFVHRNQSEKLFEIGNGLAQRYCFERLLKEAQKCDILCRKCRQLFLSK